jgi:hypothetical protein
MAWDAGSGQGTLRANDNDDGKLSVKYGII